MSNKQKKSLYGHDVDENLYYYYYYYLKSELTGRVVILTLQPPTYEILTMISRVLIISNGHVMYSGMTSLLLPYFTSVEYPCPPFKNPSDYYRKFLTSSSSSS